MTNSKLCKLNDENNFEYDFKYFKKILSQNNQHQMSKEKNNLLSLELNFDQLSIKTLYYNLINNLQLIINDLIRLFSTPIPKNQDIIQLLIYYFQNIIKILTYKERIFYLGVLLVIISFLAYFILVSS
tara:strand:+ start:359 stop:742 length:384 start_codon:yes stop_codon:yes gene_type:complete